MLDLVVAFQGIPERTGFCVSLCNLISRVKI